LLDAFQFFISNIKNSFRRGTLFPDEEEVSRFRMIGNIIPKSFRLLDTFKVKPTIFEIVFLGNNNIKYRYYLEINLNKQKINKEVAFYSPNGQETLLFEKSLRNKKINLKPLGVNKEKERAILDSLKENENVLLVSVLEKFGTEKTLPISRFSNFFSFIKTHRLFRSLSLFEDKKYKKFVVDFLKNSVDKNICDIKIKEKKSKERRFSSYRDSIFIIRKNCNGEKKEFNIMEESDGTRKIFDFSHFLYHLINKKDKTIIVFDEFDNYLHPALMEFILKFINQNIKINFQILIATHSTALIGKNLNLFRRDQIWFTQKGRDNNTELYPLTDYNTRVNDDFEKNYLCGRYGAIIGLEDEDGDL